MSANTADSELNIYDWILSPEIRNYLKSRNQRNTLPLPFKNRDLVKLDSPGFYKPVYGVLSVAGATVSIGSDV